MGRRGSWFSAVKKAISCEPKEKREKKSRKSVTWLGKERSIDVDSSKPENAAVVVPAAHSPTEDVKLKEAESEQNRHAYSVALVTAMAAEAAVAAAHAAAEVVRMRAAACTSGKTKEEVAAIKIQTAFRGYLARRALRALRGLVRLKSLIGGKSAKRQAAATLKCMQTLARVQSEIRARRLRTSEENSAIQRQIQQKHEKELEKLRASIGGNWDDRMQSKEQIEANLHNRQEAAKRRERALAYAYSHQQTWRDSSNSANQTFMDPNNPRWGWSWLERWMAARPWENVSAVDKELNNDLVSPNSTTNRSVSARGDAKTHSPTAKKQSRPPSRQSPSTPKSKGAGRIRPPSPRGTIGTDDDSRSINSTQSERCRRHSTAGSSLRDDESLASSPAVPSYMAPTESARAKSRFGLEKVGTPEKSSGSSAKKRLSFSGSPAAGPRRHSVPAKIGPSPNDAHS
ncbi:protein IQ-DOMAIN 1 [Sesamum alatum]|uniref:Protein IQ-DOMAIN 1 n=1 Tax=Sesamum alatum TaxID=300844 RepID=A0AAE2CVJ1_9LAMI|nr:protein IQ-DOMAIN 1 [Sesamum alatum]